MAEYLFLFRGGDAKSMDPASPDYQTHMQKWMQWMGDLSKEGKFLGAQPLTNAGKQLTGTKKLVTDGPYIEGKEMVGGYLLLKADSFDEAFEIAKGCPILNFETGIVEVREVQPLPTK